MLRSFAHSYHPPTEESKASNKRRQRRVPLSGEPMLYKIDLTSTDVNVIEKLVAKTLGVRDMYRDFANASNQHHIEGKLSQLSLALAKSYLNYGGLRSKTRRCLARTHQTWCSPQNSLHHETQWRRCPIDASRGYTQLQLLQELQDLLCKMGSKTEVTYQTSEPTDKWEVNARLLEAILRQKSLTSSWQVMLSLVNHVSNLRPQDVWHTINNVVFAGGSLAILLDQPSRMLNVRIKIDVWSRGLPEETQEDIREKLREIYCSIILPQRIRLYLQRVSLMLRKLKKVDSTTSEKEAFINLEGAEDTILDGTFLQRKKSRLY